MKKQFTITIPRPYRYARYVLAKRKRASIQRRRRRQQEAEQAERDRERSRPVPYNEFDRRIIEVEEQLLSIDDVNEAIESRVEREMEGFDWDDTIQQWVDDNLDLPDEDRIREIADEAAHEAARSEMEDLFIPDEDAVSGWGFAYSDDVPNDDHIGDIAREVARDVLDENPGSFVNADELESLIAEHLPGVFNRAYAARALDIQPGVQPTEGLSQAVQDYFHRNNAQQIVEGLLRNSDVLASFLRSNATRYMEEGFDDRVRYVLAQHQSAGVEGSARLQDLERTLNELTAKYNTLVTGLTALGTDIEVVESAARTMSIDLEAA